ncbi:MAG TPA: carboxymuconolactone decarboxylase family protein [Gemmatimonadaceae bacterium]|nr:carboxymuconolactone decarboxylase family protein [Gemmatimonadaceae bacterium]
MMPTPDAPTNIGLLDQPTQELLRLAAVIAVGTEVTVRAAMSRAATGQLNPVWVEELILQSYLFAGFPRALNAAREWRRVSGRVAPASDPDTDPREAAAWQERGLRTCAIVYGATYVRLRANVRELHPALDAWMITDGYGKVLSRPGLELRLRELCIVVTCAVLEQDRQLHAHLHGALNAGATPGEVGEALALVSPTVSPEAARRFALLWNRVRPG